ncbi:MAG: alpha-ketoglutarate-dependent dioxygenase AlkB [Christiangramia sp.]
MTTESRIALPDSELHYYHNFFKKKEADELLKYFLEFPEWNQDKIKLFGKEILQPRLTALFGEAGKIYTYSGLQMKPQPFTPEIISVKNRCEKYVENLRFNVCLANLYRDGTDSMGWHADDEKELGKRPVIASVSLGEERIFHLKHKKDKTLKHKIRLQHGSLLIMSGSTQEFWKHQLPKTRKQIDPRVNLTFRKIY